MLKTSFSSPTLTNRNKTPGRFGGDFPTSGRHFQHPLSTMLPMYCALYAAVCAALPAQSFYVVPRKTSPDFSPPSY